MKWFLYALVNTFNYKGRARRIEYGWAILGLTVPFFVIELIAENNFIETLVYIIYALPSISVTTRRLHDLGLSGWIQLPVWILSIYPSTINPNTTDTAKLLGVFLVLVAILAFELYLIFKDGERKENKYGVDPKTIHQV